MNKELLEKIQIYYNNSSLITELDKKEREELITLAFNATKVSSDSIILSQSVTILYHCCYACDITLEEVWELYWNIGVILFKNQNVSIKDGDIRLLYHYIFDTMLSAMPIGFPYREVEDRNQDTVVIVTSQLLSLGHAPTIRVLDYAYTLQHDLKKKVIIINDSGMHYKVNNKLHAPMRLNYIPEYESASQIDHKGEIIQFIQNQYLMPNLSAIEEMLKIIYQINPLLVYNIGASSIVADCCSTFTTSATLPCSYDIPVSCGKYLLVGRKLDEKDHSKLQNILEYQTVLETDINYQYQETNVTYTREEFKISDDCFLIGVIGNRLDNEMTDEFLEFLNTMLKEVPNCEIAFIGGINGKERIINKIEDHSKLHLLGEVDTASEFMALCDLYINPVRSGGGRSSFDALYKGVPVITQNVGDVFHTCGQDFVAEDYADMLLLLKRYINEPEYKEEKKKLAINRAKELTDIKNTLAKVIDKIIELERGR